MCKTPGFVRMAGLLAGFACVVAVAAPANAQTAMDEGFATGDAAAAWALWQPSMQAIVERDAALADQLLGQLLRQEPSAFRVALLADRTTRRTALGGAILLLEQDYESGALEANATQIAELLATGREQMNEADDGWYFCTVGRFDVAAANFQALLDGDPDPVALVEFTDQVRRRREILLQLTDNAVVGESVRALLNLLERGEELIKADPTRIKTRIERLGGPPRTYENSVALLKQSGEYAIPFMLLYLRDAEKQDLTQAILRCLPQMDRPGLNPLVYGIRVGDPVVQRYLIDALGQIGYAQAVPYLLQLRGDADTPAESQGAAAAALGVLAQRGVAADTNASPAEAFYELAEAYYDDAASLAADPRLETANVWYWRDDLLQNVAVPTQILNEVMCMRCCEEALLLSSDMQDAQALWVAANFRRVAQLGEDNVDRTRPENDPTPTYFAQTAGPGVCLKALARALDDGDPAVALGVIEALRNTAGPASVVTDEGGRLPLAEALAFPDRMVRIRAALTLANARPTEAFLNYQSLMPVLSEALRLHGGGRSALVVDPDADSGNEMAGILRDDGYEVLVDAEFFRGLDKVRAQLPALDVIFVASNLTDTKLPAALTQLRSEVRFAATPVVIINKSGERQLVRDLVQADHRLGKVQPGDAADDVRAAVAGVARAVGVTPVTPEVGLAIALDAAKSLRLLAVTNNPLFAVADAERALTEALATDDAALRLAVAHAVAHICNESAQEALAQIALDEDEEEQTRVELFAVLAEAAKLCGSHLGDGSLSRLMAIAESDENLVIRTAASQTLGALNLPANKGSEIIRNQYGG